MDVGCRVVRGPNWEWQDQDGGEGVVGVVVKGTEDIEGTVWVHWESESGRLANYRAGFEGKKDLRLLDSSGKGVAHLDFRCDGCSQHPLMGSRWMCLSCENYGLCTSCYMADTHELDCEFTRIDEYHGKGTPVGKREGATKIQAKGMFCGARVERGPDWKWGQQDGGKGGQGTVLKLQDWKCSGRNNGVSIRWDNSKRDNIYRNGGEGKIDLVVVRPESGGFYYRDHLPVFVARSKKTVSGFTTGDRVRISECKDDLQKMLEGHGGWDSSMEQCLNKIGEVYDFTKSGDVIVSYDGVKWRLPAGAITMVPSFKAGDKVLVSSDKTFVRKMQEGHGGWNEAMTSTLGMIATVKSIHQEADDVVIQIDHHLWLVNPGILTLHEAASGDDDEDDEDTADPLEKFLKQQLLQKVLSDLLGGDSKPDNDDNNPEGLALVQAASHGHLSRVKQILESNPKVINSVSMGKTSLHLACHNGFCDIITLLLERPNCDTTIKDSQGYLAIHHAAYGDKSGEAMKLMLAHGDDPNTADNPNKCTPLHLAVKESNTNAVRVLTQSDKCDVNLQDSVGDTPLHDAIQKRSNSILDLILDAPHLNLTKSNRQGFNCLHLCAYKGNPYAAQKLLSKSPELLNVAKEDGFTALHLAAVNEHCEVAEILLEQPDCKIDCVTKNHQTPLMLAVHEGYLKMVQLLEQKGANVNAKDEDGDTPLHMSLVREKFFASEMGMMLSLLGNSPESFAKISRYLICHGADVRQVNNLGKTPMDFGVGTEVEDELRKAYDEKKSKTHKEETKNVLKIVNIKTQHASAEESMAIDLDEDVHEQSNVSVSDLTAEDPKAPDSTSSNGGLKDEEEFQNGRSCYHQEKSNDSQGGPGTVSCLICVDLKADVVFLPCGHCIMCRECSARAKRCPECKKDIVSKKTQDHTELSHEDDKEKRNMEEKLQAMEKKLRKLEESVTCCVCMSRRMNMVFACGHGACQVCTEQLSTCAICKKDIERKIAMF